MRQDPIVIQPHDPRWQHDFDAQRRALERVLAGYLVAPVDHIGSTSVPGLPAKPIIDMLALVHDHGAFARALPGLLRIGWVHAPEPGDVERRTWSVCFPSAELRTHHLHVVEHASAGRRDWLLFRDYLRTHPEAARRCAALKTELAAQDRRDRVRYRSGKAPLIGELMDQARAWSSQARAF
ncbi:GrpB family protein [Promicromonospora sp. NPDC019610]|uniref:GrpB family protein n=1 Tax=Promicromonospora sp. NPDC019610 TaxID=3364405 RepID=UPI003795CFB9